MTLATRTCVLNREYVHRLHWKFRTVLQSEGVFQAGGIRYLCEVLVVLNVLNYTVPKYKTSCTIRELPYKEFVIFNLKLKDH